MTRFNYDDVVKVRSEADPDLRPDAKAWVVGIFETHPGPYFDKFPHGVVYLVEFVDGSSTEIHEKDLELFSPDTTPETRSPAMSSRTVQLHRVLRTTPEKVYRAFLEPDAMSKWIPPYGFTCTVHQMDAKVGGRFKMSFRNFSTGNGHAFGGEYLELKPNALIRYTDVFDDPNLPGVLQVTVTLRPVMGGTDIAIEQSGIPEAIPLEMCYLGWQESLAQLATLVEPEIPG
jgi:uncharacterized protein YndB with AHSA1/START domain